MISWSLTIVTTPLAEFQRPQTFLQIDRPVDLDRRRDRRGLDLLVVELAVVVVDLVHLGKPVVATRSCRWPTSSSSVRAPAALITASRGTREISPR